ncbi:hypothetical protein [Burkholderia sp. TSV86]|uniref:hypothetical protein n=1 Tax=Burkholderia sp. TSV86 TaxID=1385594 RepID=UPI000ACBEAF5|nr:hypothetical protein [Burkholderia sp. TSV86]
MSRGRVSAMAYPDRWKIHLLGSSLATCWIDLALTHAACRQPWLAQLTPAAHAALVGGLGALATLALPMLAACVRPRWPFEGGVSTASLARGRLLGVALGVVLSLLFRVSN